MADDRFRDFDLAWREKQEAEGAPQPLLFKARGRDWRMPAAIPAAIIVKVLRMQRKHDSTDDVPEMELVEIALSLFGDEQLDELMGTGLSVDELGDIIQWALQQYGVSPGPNRAARRKAGGKAKTSTLSPPGGS